MPAGPSLDTLAARWAANPNPTVCAALGDGLRKRGDIRGALALLNQGTDRFPEHVPLWIALARSALAANDTTMAETALARALTLDPHHPVALEMATATAPALLEAEPNEPVVLEGEDEDEPGPETPVLVTESLAALYHRQGHLELALAAYAELTSREPDNVTLAERYAAVQREFQAARPLPYDAAEAGGTAVSDWLGALARTEPRPVRPPEFDAFYQPPPAPPEATADFSSFRRWLQELDR
jgi:tetratricopeptide (TPR) repeat protein